MPRSLLVQPNHNPKPDSSVDSLHSQAKLPSGRIRTAAGLQATVVAGKNWGTLRISTALPSASPLEALWQLNSNAEWARMDSNHRPADYESAALTRLSYGPSLELKSLGWVIPPSCGTTTGTAR